MALYNHYEIVNQIRDKIDRRVPLLMEEKMDYYSSMHFIYLYHYKRSNGRIKEIYETKARDLHNKAHKMERRFGILVNPPH